MAIEIIYMMFGVLLMAGLLALSWVDIKTFRLPNILTYPLILFGVGSSFVLPSLDMKASIIGLGVGYFAFVAIEKTFKALSQKNGLGRGDAKLLAVGGAWSGWFGLPYIILIASFCGLVFALMPSQKTKLKNTESHIPFGPFLSLGIAVIWLCQVYLWLA